MKATTSPFGPAWPNMVRVKPSTPGSVAYFRIQGPTLVVEYAPQKNVDHIHTIYRDPTNDYGAKIAAK